MAESTPPDKPIGEQLSDSSTSIAQLLGEVTADAQHLVQQEIELAKQEIKDEVSKVVQGLISVGVGVGIAALGGVLLIIMLVFVLADVVGLDLWLSFLIVGAIASIIGGILLAVGIQRFRNLDPVPHETIETVKEDAQWAKEQTTSARK